MTISNETVKAIYIADGANVTFAIPFASFTDELADILVETGDVTDPLVPVEVVINEGVGATEYQIVGSNIVFNTAPVNLLRVLVRRDGPLTQTTDLDTYYPNDYVVLERRLDRLTLRLQEAQEQLDRTLQFYNTYNGTLPHTGKIVPGDDGYTLGWSGGVLVNLAGSSAALIAQVATNTLNIATNVANIATNVANIATNVTNIATNAAAIIVNAGNIATNAADIITNASGVAANALAITAIQNALNTGSCVLNNNQAAAIDMTDANFAGLGAKLTFDNVNGYSARLEYEIRRKDDAETRIFNGTLYLQFDGTNWVITEGPKGGVGAPYGVTWGITMSIPGQTGILNYTTTNMVGGNYEGAIKFLRTTFSVAW